MGARLLGHLKERQKRREYAKLMHEKRQRERDEIRTLEMLLGATWNDRMGQFVKVNVEYGDPFTPALCYEFFGRQGELIKTVK